MIEAAQDMTDQEIDESATYFSSMPWTHWITVKEAATVPRTRISGNVFFPQPDNETEPIGQRIIETPEDAERFELRDPRSGFIAYVPPGSIDKGALLVASGAGRTTPCRVCHGSDLMGLGPVPGIAGRSPSYLMRQFWDFKKGARRGPWSPLMQQVVKDLTQEDMLNVSAYLAAAGPTGGR
jgi:cytochrome c553